MAKFISYGCVYFFEFLSFVHTGNFFGGSLSWQSVSPNLTNTSTETIQLQQTYSWADTAWPCTRLTGPLNTLVCLIGCGIVATNISVQGKCISFDFILGISTSQSIQLLTYPIDSQLVLAYQSSSWLTLVSGIKAWSLITYINLSVRNDTEEINSSPIGSMVSIVTVPVNVQQTLRIPMTDIDQDIVKCRWANATAVVLSTTINECGGVCKNIPGAQLYSTSNLDNNCTLVFNTSSIGYYAVAIQIEDFMPSQPNGTALSSVPLQFLIRTINISCSLPTIIGELINGDIIYVQANVTFSTNIIAQTGCNNTKINQFPTISLPAGIASSSSIVAQSATIYSITLEWTPSFDQIGTTQLYCTIAVESDDLQSNEYCLNFIVIVPTTTTSTSTTSISSTTITTTSTTVSNKPLNLNLLIGLVLSLGIPLCLLLSILSACLACRRWCNQSFRGKIRRKFWDNDDILCNTCRDQSNHEISDRQERINRDSEDNRRQYINLHRSARPTNESCMSQFELNALTTKKTTSLSSVPSMIIPTYHHHLTVLPKPEPMSTSEDFNSHLYRLHSQQNNRN